MQGLFTTPRVIYNRLQGKFKGNKIINEDDVYDWVFDAEVNHIANPDDMRFYIDAELKVDKVTRKAILPCNINRIVDVYISKNKSVEYHLLPPRYIKIEEQLDTVYISYYGLHVDDEGIPYIPSSHLNALELYCTAKVIEPDALIGKYPYNIYSDISRRASNLLSATKSSWALKDHNTSNKIDAIRFNFLPLAARRRLLHRYYK